MSGPFRWAVSAALALAISLSAGSGARGERRVALVIGNARYEHAAALSNTANDAKAIADLLDEVGFDVVDRRSDLGLDEFRQAVQDLASVTFNADVVVVYYSGYGLAIDGVNYLIPADAKFSTAQDSEEQAVSLDWVLVAAGGARKFSLVILDACRENPFRWASEATSAPRGAPSGLADVKLTIPNMLVASAAKVGSICSDGDGSISPFASALGKNIGQPGLDIRSALGKVRDEVLQATGFRQEPHVYGSLDAEDALLAPAKPGAAVAPSATADIDEALDYRIAQHVGSLDGWRSFLAAHGNGAHAQSARDEVDKLLLAAKSSAPAVMVLSNNNASSGATVAGEVAPPAPPAEGTAVATLPPAASEVAPPAPPATRTDLAVPRMRDWPDAKFRNAVAKKRDDLAAAQIEEAQRVAREWKPTKPATPAKSGVGADFTIPKSANETIPKSANESIAIDLPQTYQGSDRPQADRPKIVRRDSELDSALAVKEYREAAEQGDGLAQYSLGFLYYKGQGVPRDYAKAVKWWQKGAEQGTAEAQLALGLAYANGQGLPQDNTLAYMWFDLASTQGQENATASRDNLAKKMTPTQKAEAQRLAREWKPKN
jgi:hypothetical protein